MAIKLFYQQDRLALIHDVLEQQRLMSTDTQAHAVLSETSTTPILLASDAMLSVLLFNPQTNMKSRCYSPYGHQVSHCGVPGFTGQVPEAVTGGYLLGNGYRLYSTVLMRFNSADDWSPFGAAGINPYAYCKGDPVNHSDPSGHIFKAVKSTLRRAATKALKVTDTVMYEYVKARHGKRIFKEITQLGNSTASSSNRLNSAEVKLGKLMLDETLKFEKENHQITNAHLQRANQDGEGSKIIFGEPREYIVDKLTIKSAQEQIAIKRLEVLRGNLRTAGTAKEIIGYQTRIHARLG